MAPPDPRSLHDPAAPEPVGVMRIIARPQLRHLHPSPRPAVTNDLGLEQSDDRLGQRVVVRVPSTADRRLDPGLGQALRVADRKILHAAIAVMDEPRRRHTMGRDAILASASAALVLAIAGYLTTEKLLHLS